MKWIDFAVRPGFSWPNRPVEIPFESKTVVLQPLTDELSCTASLFDDAGTIFEQGGTILSRFLSRLAWSKGSGIEELFAAGSNNPDRPGRLGRGNYTYSVWANVEPWPYLYLPLATNTNADLALGLFREGHTLNSDPLAFLSFFKVLNITLSKGSTQIAWINSNLHHIKYGQELERLNELKAVQSDIGNYLFVQGRCAVAHANTSPIAHPDNYIDKRRLHDDLPVIRQLASAFIEQELGVLSDESFWQKHRNSDISSSDILVLQPSIDGRFRYGPYSQNVGQRKDVVRPT
ncbi:MAG: methylamine utilization protein MauJ [Burkholderiaceae bacterium]